MPFTPIFADVYQLNSGAVNLWLVDGPGGLTLIDANYAGRDAQILAELRALGKSPADLKHILLTHCHPDHVGSLAALKQASGAQVWMHPADAEVVRGRAAMTGSHVSPGLLNALLFRIFIKGVSPEIAHTPIEHEVQDGEVLPCGGGIQAIYTPGHTRGHTAYRIPRAGGILILGDACSNMAGLGYSILYDDIQEGRRSLAKLARLDFQTVCFSHGSLLKGKGVEKFKRQWA